MFFGLSWRYVAPLTFPWLLSAGEAYVIFRTNLVTLPLYVSVASQFDGLMFRFSDGYYGKEFQANRRHFFTDTDFH